MLAMPPLSIPYSNSIRHLLFVEAKKNSRPIASALTKLPAPGIRGRETRLKPIIMTLYSAFRRVGRGRQFLNLAVYNNSSGFLLSLGVFETIMIKLYFVS
jgi:hypothetical protein